MTKHCGLLLFVLLSLSCNRTSAPVAKATEEKSKIDAPLSFTDQRDGQVYTYKKMKDGNFWMLDNLNFKTEDSFCYDDVETNCAKYGRLYIWKAALTSCPAGWKLPSDADWRKLTDNYGQAYDTEILEPTEADINKGKTSFAQMIQDQFVTVFSGNRNYDGIYWSLDTRSIYWASDNIFNQLDNKYSIHAYFYLFNSENGVLYRNSNYKINAYACRCMKIKSEENQ